VLQRQNSHGSIDNPVEVLLSIHISWTLTCTSSCSAEELGLPLGVLSTLCSFCTLAVFDEGLFVCGSLLVGNLDGLGDLVPQFLRLAVSLFLERTGLGVRRFGVRGIENELLLTGLFAC
jgi:hypothetical protein